MSKLDEIVSNEYNVTYHVLTGEEQRKLWVTFQPKVKQQIKNLMLELIGDVEQRETEDMTLKSWTPDDYKAFGKNELKIKLRQKVEQL